MYEERKELATRDGLYTSMSNVLQQAQLDALRL